MPSHNKLFRAVQYATFLSATTATTPFVFAQEATVDGAVVEEVVVTGSMIKRADLDGALPVQVMSDVDIQKTGVTSTADLIEMIPQMQGFTSSGESVGGSGGGMRNAALKGLGSSYTLTLLNGRRVAPSTSGSTVNLNNLPLSLIEQVEVLTDGASSLYGSDAIAGVVNFKLKKEVEETSINVRTDTPFAGGGEKLNFDITTGFGSFDEQGFNVILSYSAERQDQLAAADRDFAQSGIVEFDHDGQRYRFSNTSANSIPGNASLTYYQLDADGNRIQATIEDDNGNEVPHFTTDADGNQVPVYQTQRLAFNPYLLANGDCPQQTIRDTNASGTVDRCRFDYTSTLMIQPETTRDTVFTHANLRLTDSLTAFATLNVSEATMTARMAPAPTGNFLVDPSSPLAQQYIYSNLNTLGVTDEQGRYDIVDANPATVIDGDQLLAQWRGMAGGNRTNEFKDRAVHLVTGIEGEVGEFAFDGALTYSMNDQENNMVSGFFLSDRFTQAVNSGELDVFASQEAHQGRDYSNLLYQGNWNTTQVEMLGFDAKGSLPLFDLNGGEAQLGFGVDYRDTNYTFDISDANRDEIVLNRNAGTEYDLSRDQYGLFAEFYAPIIDDWEVTASVRYDDISGVTDNLRGGTSADMSDFTYKLQTRWTIDDTLTMRASMGTGFKAPSMLSIARPGVRSGVTGPSFECPFSASDSRASWCAPGSTQYGVFRRGNQNLKPEQSEQMSVGFVVTAADNLNMTFDYWEVEMTDLVADGATPAQIFGDADQYSHLLIALPNNLTQQDELSVVQEVVNIGTSSTRGFDYNVEHIKELSFGQLTTKLSGSHLFEATNSQVEGTKVGVFAADNDVLFADKLRLSFTLDHGNFMHNLGMNYQSGYVDASADVQRLDESGNAIDTETLTLDVPSYTRWNYSLNYRMLDDALSVTAGINNLFDKEPPLSLKTGSGHQIGYDPRYFDSYGRTGYLQAKYAF